MKKYVIAGVAGTVFTAAMVELAVVALAAPTGPTLVERTVKSLEADGYNVIINRTGSAPLASCTLQSVRPGQTHRTVDSRGGSSPSETIVSQTVYVDVAC